MTFCLSPIFFSLQIIIYWMISRNNSNQWITRKWLHSSRTWVESVHHYLAVWDFWHVWRPGSPPPRIQALVSCKLMVRWVLHHKRWSPAHWMRRLVRVCNVICIVEDVCARKTRISWTARTFATLHEAQCIKKKMKERKVVQDLVSKTFSCAAWCRGCSLRKVCRNKKEHKSNSEEVQNACKPSFSPNNVQLTSTIS